MTKVIIAYTTAESSDQQYLRVQGRKTELTSSVEGATVFSESRALRLWKQLQAERTWGDYLILPSPQED